MKAVIVMTPASLISLATSPTRRIFSSRSAGEKLKESVGPYCSRWFPLAIAFKPLSDLFYPDFLELLLSQGILWGLYIAFRIHAKKRLDQNEPSYFVKPNADNNLAVSGENCMAVAFAVYFAIKIGIAILTRLFLCDWLQGFNESGAVVAPVKHPSSIATRMPRCAVRKESTAPRLAS